MPAQAKAVAASAEHAPVASYKAKKQFKYPSEDEPFVRRLGSALLANWSSLPEDVRAKILSDAAQAWDREFNIPALPQKLETYVKRYPGRVG